LTPPPLDAERPKPVQPLTKRQRAQLGALLGELALPAPLSEALTAAAEQELVPRDAAALGQQMRDLLVHSKGPEGLQQAAAAAAAALGLTLPQALGVLAALPMLVSMAPQEMQRRVELLAEAVGARPAAAAQLVAGNAALLAVPPEQLAAKLALLSKTAGLAPLAATRMITVYMFPDIRWA
jgi:hypothetical protein